jgi:hypothetical protein
MSDFSDMLVVLRTDLAQRGVRYKAATSTSAGTSDGTTIISTSLTQLDDAWNGCECVLSTGEVKKVEDFTASTDTLTFTNNPFPKQVGSGVSFELFEPGTWRGDDLKRFIEQAGRVFTRIAPDDILRNFAVRESKAGSLGTINLPSEVLRFVEPILLINGKKVDILPPEEASYLTEGAFIDPTDGAFIGYFAGRQSSSQNVGQFKYKPAVNQSGTWHFVPRPSFDTSGNWKVPEELWEPIIFIATNLALLANEMIELAAGWERQAMSYLPKQAETEK